MSNKSKKRLDKDYKAINNPECQQNPSLPDVQKNYEIDINMDLSISSDHFSEIKDKEKIVFDMLKDIQKKITEYENNIANLQEKLDKKIKILTIMQNVAAIPEAKNLKIFQQQRSIVTENMGNRSKISKCLLNIIDFLETQYKNNKKEELRKNINLQGTIIQGEYPYFKVVLAPNLLLNVTINEEEVKITLDGRHFNTLSMKKISREVMNIVKVIQSNSNILDDEQLIIAFTNTFNLFKQLRGHNSDYLEIIDYLILVQDNLKAVGCYLSLNKIKNDFGRLFTQLGMVPVKGRDSDKFIQISDNFGNKEDFVFLKLS